MTLAVVACGGDGQESLSGSTLESLVADDDDGALRLAGERVDVVNGCTIEPHTRCTAVDLRGADLSGVNLAWATLRRVDLSGARLVGADLRGADLRETDLSGADLSGAQMRGADLRSATLTRTDLSGAMLDRARFSAISQLNSSIIDGARMTGTRVCDIRPRPLLATRVIC